MITLPNCSHRNQLHSKPFSKMFVSDQSTNTDTKHYFSNILQKSLLVVTIITIYELILSVLRNLVQLSQIEATSLAAKNTLTMELIITLNMLAGACVQLYAIFKSNFFVLVISCIIYFLMSLFAMLSNSYILSSLLFLIGFTMSILAWFVKHPLLKSRRTKLTTNKIVHDKNCNYLNCYVVPLEFHQ